MSQVCAYENEDDIINFLAEVRVKYGVWPLYKEDEILKEFGLQDKPKVIQSIFMVGLKAIAKKVDFYERLKLKTIKLDPSFYVKKEQEWERENSKVVSVRNRRHKKQEEEREESRKHADKVLKELSIAMTLYDNWKLSSGKKLGDATKEDLLKESEINKNSAEGHMKNCKFYSSLADKVPEGSTVSQSVGIEEAHKLREEVYT
jgi:hypothetical protein